ncbi:DASS family sodium-coupled anion symporter [Oleispirillum naphthae]|uniref:DASS family sodium-coupled anion symporter n=1 Tax=Oleispirillum naphthae TaxID=2838853 RepID=UPI0030822371
MFKNKKSLVIWLGIPIILLFIPCPAGLDPKAWHLFAFYCAAILGLILRPFSEPVVLLVALATYSIGFNGTSIALAGYGSATTWLVFAACLVGKAFVDTGLGSRIAYFLIDKFGSTSLRLGYAAAITDLIIAPATPSNTARTGGIVYPIFRSIAITLGSEPGPTSKKIGANLSLLCNAVSLTTASMFMTSSAPNLLVFSFAVSILGLNMSWGEYALAAFPPCFVLLMIIPLFYNRLARPELDKIDNKVLAAEGLKKLGPTKIQEKVLAALFVLALILWGTSQWTKVNSGAVAIAFIAGVLFFRVVEWDDLLKEKSAWSTMIWYGAIISLATGLAKLGFFKWIGSIVAAHISFGGLNPGMVMALLILSSLPLRYIFASNAAWVGTMVPVYMMLAQGAHVPPALIAVSLCSTASLGCFVTHFGHGMSVVLFGAGYVDQKTWWILGGIMAVFANLLVLSLGMLWWPCIGIW